MVEKQQELFWIPNIFYNVNSKIIIVRLIQLIVYEIEIEIEVSEKCLALSFAFCLSFSLFQM